MDNPFVGLSEVTFGLTKHRQVRNIMTYNTSWVNQKT